jgi:hypothetical protein
MCESLKEENEELRKEVGREGECDTSASTDGRIPPHTLTYSLFTFDNYIFIYTLLSRAAG